MTSFFGGGGSIISESETDTDGELEFYEFDVHFFLSELKAMQKYKGEIDIFVGHQFYTDELRDRNGVQTIIDGARVNQPFGGLNSTFDFEWEGYRVGIRVSHPLSTNITLNVSLARLWELEYDGAGFWNLRDDFRQTSPNFTQKADGGDGISLDINVAFRVLKHLLLRLGVWYTQMEVSGGKDTIFFSDGTSAGSSLDRVETERLGFYGGAVVPF